MATTIKRLAKNAFDIIESMVADKNFDTARKLRGNYDESA